MLLSARAAARVLADVGVTRGQTMRLLAAGFAGPATAAGGALLYEERRVRDLAARPQVDVLTLDAVCPGGVLTVRRDVDLTAPPSAQRDQVRKGWPFSLATMAVLRLRVQRHGWVSLVASRAGFVSLGADIVEVYDSSPGSGTFDLTLTEPGPWFDGFSGRRWWSGPGRGWSLTGWDRSSGATRPVPDGPALQE